MSTYFIRLSLGTSTPRYHRFNPLQKQQNRPLSVFRVGTLLIETALSYYFCASFGTRANFIAIYKFWGNEEFHQNQFYSIEHRSSRYGRGLNDGQVMSLNPYSTYL